MLTQTIDMNHSKASELQLDIHLDVDKGVLKMKRLRYLDDEKHEPYISNIECDINDGWIAHFIFGNQATDTHKVRIAKVGESFYGEQIDIS